MWGQSKQASSATMALIYLTVGALTVVWTIVYHIYLSRHEASETAFYWCYGFFFSGLVLIALGLGLGAIGRATRPAEVAAAPPVQMVNTPAPVAAMAPNAAAQPSSAPAMVAPSSSAAPPAATSASARGVAQPAGKANY